SDPTPETPGRSPFGQPQQRTEQGLFKYETGELFGSDPMMLKVTCSSCSDLLFGKPKIRIEGQVYCYKCAKKTAQTLEETKQKQAELKYQTELERYEQLRLEFEKRRSAWDDDRREYITSAFEVKLISSLGGWLWCLPYLLSGVSFFLALY